MNIRETKFIQSRCTNPVKVSQWNPVINQYEVMEVPCGKCDHCRMTHQNEWCTRMYLEAKYNKYVYFVTLTYDKNCNAKILRETNAIFCSINSFNRYEKTPLTLNKTHTQEFWKRLRYLGYKVSYVIVGEYGHKFGRPHYHAIVYTDTPISNEDFEKAWSLHGVHIGNVDVKPISLDDTDSMDHAFGYVTKYIQKQFDFKDIPTLKQHIKNQNRHEKYEAHGNKLCKEYIKDYKPFMLCSRTHAIGSGYLQDHIQRFAEGDYRLFGVSKDYIFPSYFRRKAKEYLCPIQTVDCIGRLSSTPSHLASLFAFFNDISAIEEHLLKDIQNGFSPMEIFKQNRFRIGEMTRQHPLCSQPVAIDETAFYNKKTKSYYLSDGEYYYRFKYSYSQKKWLYKDKEDAQIVLEDLWQKWQDYLALQTKMYMERLQREKQFREAVILEFHQDEDDDLDSEDMLFQVCYDRWKEYANEQLQALKLANETKQKRYLETKPLF